ncbi:MAG TPA: PHP domain-containing protein [Candidatus Acidoferrales bacterium]|nr:PHP domain-containing protein [Candidatus Acidoferrales bacterium]
MTIDLHIHSNASDGKLSAQELIAEAKARKIDFMAITDHDNISCQTVAIATAKKADIDYITGVELNVTFSNPKYKEGKPFSLDFLGYQFDLENKALKGKLELMAKYREERAAKILDNLNTEFRKENIPELTTDDLCKIQENVEGSLGRPHIADYLVKKGIVADRLEAFNKYLVKCDVPKYPLSLEEASKLIRDAGGKLVLAHPTDQCGISLLPITKVLAEQTQIIQDTMLPYIDGIECWHLSHTPESTSHYVAFAKNHGLLMMGGSDCHQKPIIMGSVDVPSWVAGQFKK